MNQVGAAFGLVFNSLPRSLPWQPGSLAPDPDLGMVGEINFRNLWVSNPWTPAHTVDLLKTMVRATSYGFPEEVLLEERERWRSEGPVPDERIAYVGRLVFGLSTAVYCLRLLLLTKWRGWARRLLTMMMAEPRKPVHNHRSLRSIFASTPLVTAPPRRDHSHARAAAHRATATASMNLFATLTGLVPFSYQMSSRESSEHVAGTRTYYWAKDVDIEPRFDIATDSNLITMVDVDYYVDMPTHLAHDPKPHLISTIIPETAGRTNEDYNYSFKNNVVTFNVCGGASYSHELWNWSVDWFTATRKIFGIPYCTVTYDCVARQVSPDKSLVLLTPIRTHYGLSAILAHFMGRPLRRLVTNFGNFSKVVTRTPSRRSVSVTRAGMETSCTISGTQFDSLLTTQSAAPKNKLNLYQVKSLLKGGDMDEDSVSLFAPILTEYLNANVDESTPQLSLVELPTSTQVAFAVPDPSDKPCMVSFAKPFGVPPAFVPLDNKDSSDQSIAGRVLKPRADVKKLLGELKMTTLKSEALQHFVEFLVPNAHVGVPYDFESIAEKQQKPGQRRDLEEAGLIGYVKSFVKTFMKREAYGKPTDPRNISTFPAKTRLTYAAYMYPIMDFLKPLPFYAFGQTPRAVATRVAEICMGAKRLVACPDISRMDGHVNSFCRQLERAVGLRFFAPEFAEGFLASHSASFDNTGITTHGTRYDQDASRGSGEMGTSAWNTIINLYVLYYAFILQRKSGASYPGSSIYKLAWEDLVQHVLAGGDDGLVADLDDTFIIRAGRDTGFFLTVPVYRRGEIGVNFLARVYGPNVWEGCPDSMCSLRRQMEKFHLTPAVPLSAADKLHEKAVSFNLTDANTPLLGKLCSKILSCFDSKKEVSGLLARWGDNVSREEQYPNDAGDWMNSVAESELPLTLLRDFDEWLSQDLTIDELLECPPFYQTGREFTYDEYDPDHGLLIKKSVEVLGGPPALKRQRACAPSEPSPRPAVVPDISFGE